MKVYQIVCKGERALFDENGLIYSSSVYTTKEFAEEHILEFEIKCCTPINNADMKYFHKVIKTQIVELEIIK